MLITLWISGITQPQNRRLHALSGEFLPVFLLFHNFFNRIILSSVNEKSVDSYTNSNIHGVNCV